MEESQGFNRQLEMQLVAIGEVPFALPGSSVEVVCYWAPTQLLGLTVENRISGLKSHVQPPLLHGGHLSDLQREGSRKLIFHGRVK